MILLELHTALYSVYEDEADNFVKKYYFTTIVMLWYFETNDSKLSEMSNLFLYLSKIGDDPRLAHPGCVCHMKKESLS